MVDGWKELMMKMGCDSDGRVIMNGWRLAG